MIIIISKPDPMCYMDMLYAIDLPGCCNERYKVLIETLKEEGCEFKVWEGIRHVVIKLGSCKRFEWIDDFKTDVTVIPDDFIRQ